MDGRGYARLYVSTSGVSARKICDAVTQLSGMGFRRIELSGGTDYYPTWFEDLEELRQRFGLSYRLHNYFPPVADPFVLNLASEDELQFERSFDLVKTAIEISKRFESTQLGFHAGFLNQVTVSQLGNEIRLDEFKNSTSARARFRQAYFELKSLASESGIQLYVENNVLSGRNYESFGGRNLLMMCDSDEIVEAYESGVAILLDLAHLKVSSMSLGYRFEDELRRVWKTSNYLHLSDNDGHEDQNRPIESDSAMFAILEDLGLQDKTVTLEIYDDSFGLQATHARVLELMD
jgi:sugar phosphate isomerase/epimerase